MLPAPFKFRSRPGLPILLLEQLLAQPQDAFFSMRLTYEREIPRRQVDEDVRRLDRRAAELRDAAVSGHVPLESLDWLRQGIVQERLNLEERRQSLRRRRAAAASATLDANRDAGISSPKEPTSHVPDLHTVPTVSRK